MYVDCRVRTKKIVFQFSLTGKSFGRQSQIKFLWFGRVPARQNPYCVKNYGALAGKLGTLAKLGLACYNY